MKFTLSWLKDHLDTTASVDEIADQAVGDRPRGRRHRRSGQEARRVHGRARARGQAASERRQPARVHRSRSPRARPPSRSSAAPPTPRGHADGVRAARHLHSRLQDYAWRRSRCAASSPTACCAPRRSSSSRTTAKASSSSTARLSAGHVGDRYIDAAGLSDPVIEVKLTPNRPDCTGVRGIARDLAAAGLGKLKPEPKFKHKVEGEFASPVAIKLDFTPETANACPVFAGRYVKGVKNGPSPEWLQKRLKAVGLRPINALVDVTNYIIQRPRPSAARLRCRQAARRDARAARQAGREVRGARWQGVRRRSRRCASSPTTMARSASAASWAARPQAARTTPRTC